MKEVIRYGFTLGLICALASTSLAIVNSITRPIIIARVKAEEEASLRKVMPEGEYFEPVKSGEEIIYYRIKNKDGEFIGAAFKTSKRGYSGIIETMVGMARNGKITAINILNQNETPGLGANITNSSFRDRFINKDIQDKVKIQAIAGATISSKAVIDSVQKKAIEISRLINEE